MAILYSYEEVFKFYGLKMCFYLRFSVSVMVNVGFLGRLLNIRSMLGFCWDGGILGIKRTG
jgi:hypothetical protein